MEKVDLQAVIDFFGKNRSCQISTKTEINNDLEIIGDDAYFVMIDFGEKFNVDFDRLDLSVYFLPELGFRYWYYKWFKPGKLKMPPVTIGHMTAVAQRGYWFDPKQE